MWKIEVFPAMIFTNALPCSLTIEITQPPVMLHSQEEQVAARRLELAPRELFFLPNDIYDLTRDTNVYSLMEPAQISWQPFENDNMVTSFTVLPGSSWQLPCYLSDRDLYLRLKITGTILWSKVYVFCRDLLCHRSTFRKHKPEDLNWNYSRTQDITLERGPQVKFKRVWKIVREVIFFSEFWIINKIGLACFYETKPPKGDEKIHEISGDYKTLLFTQTEYSDNIQKQFMGNLSIPVLLTCPNRRLRIMPYCMINELNQNNFYLYDLWCSSKNPYIIQSQPSKIYSDSDWKMTSLPSFCRNSKNYIYLQTPNKDRLIDPSNENCLSFKVSSNCFVFICVDARCRMVPSWMRKYGFSSLGERIHTTNPHTVYQAYRKFYRAHDCIRLGGNGVKIASDSRSSGHMIDMYLVFINESPPSYSEPTIVSIAFHPSIWKLFSSSPRFALKPNIKMGDHIFLDRDDISITSLPPMLTRLSILGIQTYAEDKNLGYQNFIELTIQHPSRLMLCIDVNIDIDDYPLWISKNGFVMTNSQVTTRDHTFIILYRLCGAETISLGTLSSRLRTSVNYFLLIVDEQEFIQGLGSIPFCNPGEHSVISFSELKVDMTYSVCTESMKSVVYQQPKFDEDGRQWSQYFDVAPGNSGELRTACGFVSVQVSPLPGLFHRTSIVTLLPRFIIVNQLSISVEIHPIMCSFPPTLSIDLCNKVELPPSSSGIIYSFTKMRNVDSVGVTDKKQYKRWICIRECARLPNSSFSRAISLDDLGEVNLWLPIHSDVNSNSRLLISANVMLQGNIMVVTLKDDSLSPPYRLENRSFSHILEYRQYNNASSTWRSLHPGTWESFVWDNPYGGKYLELKLANTSAVSEPICLDEIGRIPNFSWNSFRVDLSSFLSATLRTVNDEMDDSSSISSGIIGGCVYANGITRVLLLNEISAKSNSPNLFDFLRKSNKDNSLLHLKSDALSYFDVFRRLLIFSKQIRGIHINVFNEDNENKSEEIITINLEGLLFNLDSQASRVEFSLYHFQIDDMRKLARFPVIVNPANSGFNSHLGEDDTCLPFLQIRCQWKYGSLSTDILHLSEFQVLVQPLNLKVDMELIVYLAKTVGRIVKETHTQYERITPEVASVEAAIDFLSQTIDPYILQTFSTDSKKPIYIELFHYGSLTIYAEV